MPPANLKKHLTHWKQQVISIVLLSEMRIKPRGDDLQAGLWLLCIWGPSRVQEESQQARLCPSCAGLAVFSQATSMHC